MKDRILNLTNHVLTPEQVFELQNAQYEIVEMNEELKELWKNMTPDNFEDIVEKAMEYAEKNNCNDVIIAGFQPAVVEAIRYYSAFNFFYAFSERESFENVNENGVFKSSRFVHKGFFMY